MKYKKATLWNGSDLVGTWELTLKVDGVRALIVEGVAMSRAGKKLYGLSHLTDGDYEIFCSSWEDTITAVRTVDAPPVPRNCAYSISDSKLDPRLFIKSVCNPSKELLLVEMGKAIKAGYEGLVLRQGDKWLKVKPHETYDVPISGTYPGKGRHTGRIGGFYTAKGKVGTGLTDKQREELSGLPTGTIIEVACMSLTKNGMFRHPRFIRVRYDKNVDADILT